MVHDMCWARCKVIANSSGGTSTTETKVFPRSITLALRKLAIGAFPFTATLDQQLPLQRYERMS